ncbi:MAG: ThuA domain-containing protein [Halioglobus sp.]|nr:ThuA domain-containing protein [Halioglobus sp.]
MSIIKYNTPSRLLTIARGHPYDREAFAELVSALEEFDVCHVEQPVAQRCLGPQAAHDFDAILCYDMPGVDFTAGDTPELAPPSPEFVRDYLAMLDVGMGIVFMHHALAAWPAWPLYADIVGGRFHYRPAQLHGEHWPDSGYRHQVTHRVTTVGTHPVTEGLPEHFEITDELYLCPVFEDDVIPLLRSDYTFGEEHFYSAASAVAGQMNSREGWSHPPGSSLVGWAKRWGNSPIVYLQGGDDASAMANPHFRQLVHNAVRWVSSDAAHAWARSNASVPPPG